MSVLIIGFIAAVIIGVVLGLIGGGGSILTVPVFVYALGIDPLTATAYSLFVVGVSAAVGAFRNAQAGLVDFKTGIIFSIPAFIAVYLTRKLLIPAIPEHLFSLAGFDITRDLAIMVFFGVIMVAASYSMIRGAKMQEEEDEQITYNFPLIIVEGAVVGVLTGIVGAGGGFLIIPALVLLAKLPMKKAVATSLMIIAAKSLIGFLGDVQNTKIEWQFLLPFTAFSVIGIFLGLYLNRFVDGNKLKKAFGWFVLIMGVYIILSQIL